MKKITVLLICLLAYPCTVIHSQENPKDIELKKKIGQMLIVGFRGTELNPNMTIYKDIVDRNIGGVILFDYDVPTKTNKRNIESVAQLQRLCRELQKLTPKRLFISIDQEGGKVSRLKSEYGFPPTASALFLGNNKESVASSWAGRNASNLSSLGINLNFAPCVDVDVNPDCPVIGALERSFSDQPEKVARYAKLWIKEHDAWSIGSVLKHFPGHGSSSSDSHKGFVDVSKTWSRSELIPYERLIQDNTCRMIMTAHVFNAQLDEKYPATLSYNTITKLLRQGLSFDGVVVSDDMDMGAITKHYSRKTALEKAINAGVDIIIISNNGKKYKDNVAKETIDIIFKLVREGNIPESRIHASYARIANLKNTLK